MGRPRLGLAGVGALGSRHARVLAEQAKATGAFAFSGVFDLKPDRSSEVAATYGVPAHTSFASLCEASDGILVVVPTVAHAEVAVRAIEAGCDVFVEKPIADSLTAADRILAAAAAAGRTIHVGHSERMNPAVRAATGALRAPRYIEARRLAGFTPRATDVDVVLDLMIHDIDLVLAFAGAEPSSVEAIGVAVLTESEDLAHARLEFPSGAVATLTASRVSPDRLRKLRLFSDHAYVSFDLLKGTAETAVADRKKLAEAAQVYAQHASHAAGRAVTAPAVLPDWTDLLERRELAVPSPALEPLALEILAFAAAVGAGAPVAATGPFGPASGADGRAALAVAIAVRDAMRVRAARFST